MLNKTNIAIWASMMKWRNQCAPHLVNARSRKQYQEELHIFAKTCKLCIVFLDCDGCPLYNYQGAPCGEENEQTAWNVVYRRLYEDRRFSSSALFNSIEQMFDVLADLCPPMPDN